MSSKIKFHYYAASVGALLAISGGAHAVIRPGEIINGPDGDAILDHNHDYVYIDINDDGEPDFIVDLDSFSGTYTTTTSSVTSTFHLVERLVRIIAASSYFVDNTLSQFSTYYSSTTYTFSFNIFARNNHLNDVIGPINYPNGQGMISYYTNPTPSTPIPFIPNFDGTNGDEGYIGVGMLSPGGTNYGWIHINIGPDCIPVTFDTCAMEHTDNAPIVAGNSLPVPLLPIASAAGLGLIGLMAALKKRKKVTV